MMQTVPAPASKPAGPAHTPAPHAACPNPSGHEQPASARRLAKIVATIGPASDSPEMVRRLIDAGVSVFRFNFSHGTLEDHARRLATVRGEAKNIGVPIACLGDLQGPKIRIGKIPAGVGAASPSGGGLIAAQAGQDIILSRSIKEAIVRMGRSGPEPVLPVTYPDLIDEVEIGHRVLINDGAVRMLAVEKDPAAGELRCRVVSGGPISSGKGINLPQSNITAPAITERDWECAKWAVEHELDYLALSFVRNAADVEELRTGIKRIGGEDRGWIPIVSKIEKPQAVEAIESIVAASDAIMVARGDLGVEMDIAQVPVAQKQIMKVCAQHGKPCIVATQMLETMIENATPTRAEASDVANAIFDGADAVMLSAETATGKHPALVVETMARIICVAEDRLRSLPVSANQPVTLTLEHRGVAALAHGAWAVANELGARVVICWSQNGGTARYLSQNRFHIPILAYSSNPRSAQRMSLLRGVTPICTDPPGDGTLAAWNAAVDSELRIRNLAVDDDPIVLLAGRPLGRAKATNTLALSRVGEAEGGYKQQA